MNFAWRLAALAIAATSLNALAGDPPARLADGALVAASGMTLYTFDRDQAVAGTSACNGPCAALWPPLAARAADQPAGAFSLVSRADGAKQWAYKGMPLYFYKADQKPGDRTGDNFNNVWHIVPN
jgi:predicted lipoprotein with Yx(FWY)xxD motif